MFSSSVLTMVLPVARHRVLLPHVPHVRRVDSAPYSSIIAAVDFILAPTYFCHKILIKAIHKSDYYLKNIVESMRRKAFHLHADIFG